MESSSYNQNARVEVGEEYPYPYPSHVSAPNFVTLKLSGRDNYSMWKTQMLCLLKSHGMLGFIDGTLVSPQTSVYGKEKVGDRHWLWTRSDALVQGWILASLTEQTLKHVMNRLTKRTHQHQTTYGPPQQQTIYGPPPPQDIYGPPPQTIYGPPPPQTIYVPPPPQNIYVPPPPQNIYGPPPPTNHGPPPPQNIYGPPPPTNHGPPPPQNIYGPPPPQKIYGPPPLQTINSPPHRLADLDREEEERARDDQRLYQATLAGDLGWLRQMLFSGNRLLHKITNNGNTALHVAVSTTKKPEFLVKLLEMAPENTQLLDLRNSDGSTLLHIAAIIGNTAAVDILMGRNQDLLLATDNESRTPLHIALSNMHTETAQHLLQHINTDIEKDTLFSGVSGDELLISVISSKDFGSDILIDNIYEVNRSACLYTFGRCVCGYLVEPIYSILEQGGVLYSYAFPAYP